MKRIATILILFISLTLIGALPQLYAQSTANYTYGTSTTGSLALDKDGNAVDMSAGTTQLYGAGVDTYTGAVQTLGFNFVFMGTPYSQFSANPDGQVRLGSTAISGHTQSATVSVPYIIVNNIDSKTDATTGKVSYKIQAGTGGQVLIVEWSNILINWNAAGTTLSTFQLRLYQATGTIEMVYGQMWNSSTSAQTGSIAFSSSNTAGTIGQLTTITGTPTYNSSSTSYTTTSFTASSAMTNLNSASNGSRRVFSFTPPAAPSAPTNLTFTSVGGSLMTLNWTDNATTETGYAIYRSTDGTNYTYITTTAANATSSAQSGLSFGTTYYWNVYAVNEGMASSALNGSQATSAPSLSGTKTVGTSGDYTNLTTAIAAINSNGLAGNLSLQLISGYPAAAETYPITAPSTSAMGSYILTIYPNVSGLSISGSNATAILDFNGTKNVVVDGRVGATGSTKDLIVENTNTSGATIRFINDANLDTVKYCTIKGVNTSTTSGVVLFSTTTGANGNDNITITNCDIRDGATTPVNGIYASGTTTTTATNNSGVTISNNNIYNFFSAGSVSTGILVSSGNTDWTISSNSFYQTATRVFTTGNTHTVINISNSSGNNFTVSGNYIGGTSANAGGTPWMISGTAVASRMIGIGMSAGTTTASNIQNNTIANWSLRSTSGAATTNGIWCGINVTNGNVNVGTTTGNTIGSGTGNGSITDTCTTTGGLTVGINSSSAGTVSISNNTIGSINAYGSTTSISASIIGIQVSSATGTLTISNNLIGSRSTANSLNIPIASTNATGSVLTGIISSSSATTINITNNTIANANSNYAGTAAAGQVRGIVTSSGVNNISNNMIRNLSTTTSNSGSTSSASAIGIAQTSTTAGQIISQDTIHTLTVNPATATTAIQINGIYYSGPSTGTNTISRNLIHSFSTNNTNVTANTSGTLNGIHIFGGVSTYQNNMVRLGIDAAGSGVSGNYIVSGIRDNATANNNFYHNSVYIGGGSVTGSSNSHGYIRASTGTTDFRDNLIVNSRSNGTGTGKHYAMSINATTTFTSNYNVYYSSGTGFVFGVVNTTDASTFSAWKSATSQDGNSAFGDPQFIAPTGTSSTVDLHIHASNPTPIEGSGTTIAAVTDDFDGQTRSGLTPVDIGADAGNFVGLDISGPVITYTTLGNTTTTSSLSFSNVTITDVSGVNTTAGTKPRVYYKKTTNTNTVNDNTNATDGWKYVEANGTSSPFDFTIDPSLIFGGSVAVGDTIQYFVVAQDNATTPNVAINSGTFTSAPTSVALTSGAFPLTGTINSYRVLGSISGTKTVGASGADYATITAAVADLNSKVLTGVLIFSLIDASYSASETFPIVINANSGSSATNTVTFKPTGITTISGSSASSIFKLNGADYVIIDGSSTALSLNGTDKSLTIRNTSGAASTAVVWIASAGTGAGATNNTIQNCNMRNGSFGFDNYGVFVGGTSISSSGTGADNDFTTITNNSIDSTTNGVYAVGTASISTGGLDNLAVSNNSISSNYGTVLNYGMRVGNALNSTISQNTVSVQTSASSQPVGISLETGFVSSTVSRNLISKVITTATGGYGGRGMTIGTGTASSNLTIANNMIYNVNGSNYSSFTNSSSMGITIGAIGSSGTLTTTTGGINLFDNSVNMYGSYTYAANCLTAALYVGSGASALDIRNNIFMNSMNNTDGSGTASKNYAVYSAVANTGYTTINYNDYYSSGTQGVLGFLTADQTTISAWRTATGKDVNSLSGNPIVTSNTDLHINLTGSVSPVSNAGTNIAAVTTDYDGEARNGSTPDIGADEFSYPVPLAFTLTSPSGAGQGVSGTLTWAASTNALKYDVYMDQNNPPTTLLAGNVVGTSTGYSNLSPSTTYYWEVYAEGADSANGGYTKSTNGPLSFITVTPPADPSVLTLTNVTKDSVYLSWTDNAADGPNQDTGFVVYRKAGSAPNVGIGSPDSVASIAALAGTGTVNYQDHSLLPNVRYYYRVSARNANGESNFTSADTTTLAAVPAAPTASNPLYTAMTLALADPTPNPATTQFAVRVQYAGSALPTMKYVHTNGALVDTAVWGTYANFGSSTGVTVTGLTLSTEYIFDVEARNANNIATAFSSTTTQSTLSPIASYPYNTDFEGVSDNGWSSAAVTLTTNDWVRGTPAKTQIASAHSGTKAWITKTTGTYSNNFNAAVFSPLFNFSGLATDPSLLFWHNFKTEAGYEGLVVEYTTNSGSTWRRVDSTLGTGGNFTTAKSSNWYNSSSTSGNVVPPKFSGGTTAFTGHASGWIQSTTLLTGLAGQPVVQFRWRFNSETSGQDEGWAIDDIRIATDVIPPTIAYTALTHTTSTANRQLVATIKGGVDLRPAGAPRIYYKKNTAGSYQSTQASLIADTSFTFDIDHSLLGGVVAGDSVLYYVAAQDSNGNAVTSPSGSSASIDPPNATVSSPSLYIIIGAPLSGDYNVGLAMFNRLSGNDLTFERRTRVVKVEVPNFSSDAKSALNPEEATRRQIPAKNTKWIEVEEEYFVPMMNGKEYTGELYAQDKMSPNAGAYATISAAIGDLNLRGVSGAVRYLLTDASYTGETLPITINSITGSSATNTITIRPATSVASSVSGSSATALFKLSGADYVTIDGSNSGGTDRSLTLSNTGTGTSSAVIWVGSNATDGSTNNTVKNTIISGNASTTTAVGIYSGSGTTIYAASTAANSSNTYENNKISKSQDGIFLAGMSATTLDQNTIVRNNNVGSSTAGDGTGTSGITAVYQNNALITGNEVQNVVGALTYDMAGIDLEEATASTVSSNKIHNVSYTGTSSNKVNVLYTTNSTFISSGSPSGNTFANNMLYDVTSSNTSSYYSVSGLTSNGGYDDKFYFNSVYLAGSMGTNTTGYSFCFSNGNPLTSTFATNLDVRNNVFVNKGTSTAATKEYAIYTMMTSSTGSTFNNNDYLVAATGSASSVLGFFNAADRANLTAWQTATSQDANTISSDPLFTSSTDLHIVTTPGTFSPIANIGTSIAGITTDIDGDTRSSSPDPGADEFVLPAPAAFSLISPTGTGTPVSPVLLWHKSTGATRYDVYVGTDNPPMTLVANNVSDTSYTFSGSSSTVYYWDVKAETPDSGAGSRTSSSNGPLTFTTVDAPASPSNLTLTTGFDSPGEALKSKIAQLELSKMSATRSELRKIEEQLETLKQQLTASIPWIELNWLDNATNEDSFYVYAKAGSVPSIGAPYTDRIAVVAPSVGTGGSVIFTNVSLDLDKHYYYRVTAFGNSVESGFTSADTTTLAETPEAPTFNNVSFNTMKIHVSPATNPANTEFAIKDSATGQYVKADGTIGSATEVWQTYTGWGGASGIALTGLSRGTVYSFTVKAKNGAGVQTSDSPSSSQQTTFEQLGIVLSEGFEGASFPPTGWQAVQNDGGAVNWIRAGTYQRTGTYAAEAAYESSILTNDDWLITPLVTIPSNAAFLNFYYRARSASFIDSFEVWLTTTGSTPADFINNGVKLYNNSNNNFTAYQYKSIDLAAYAGQNVYIAWRYDATDQWQLYIDDINMTGVVQPNTITVRKYRDADGSFGTTGDRTAKAWRLELHADSVAGTLMGSVDSDTVLTVPNLLDGTYYAVEADSAGWLHLGNVVDATATASTNNYASVSVTGGSQSKSVSFINFQPNTVVVNKYQDADGDFGTTGDRNAKAWQLTVYNGSVAPGNIVGSSATGSLTVNTLGDGTFIVAEADSSGWGSIGKIVNGTPVTGSAMYDTFTVSGAQTHTVDFINQRYSGIIVNKYRDVNGGSVTFDQAKSWYLTVRTGDCNGTIIASGNATTISALNIAPGTYYISEADSAGWTHAGYRVNGGSVVEGSSSCVTVVVGSGEQHTVDFANFHPNSVTLSKLYDADGSFGTTGDRSAKAWQLTLYSGSIAQENIVTSGSSGTLSVNTLGDGTYIAVEADSLGWAAIGMVVNGSPVAGSSRNDTFTVANGQSHSTDFVNTQTNSITVRKFRDTDGGALSADEARSWFLTVRSGSCSGTIVASGNATSVVASNLAVGTYYVTEADSAGWTHAGYRLNGGEFVAGSSGCLTVTVGAGETQTVDFINFHANTITLRKYQDTDGGSATFEASISWGLYLKNATNQIVAEAENTVLTANNLGDGTYTAFEADSAFWHTTGYRLDGLVTSTSSVASGVEITVADGQVRSIDFANAIADTMKFYSVRADSFALDTDSKGAQKSISKKADKVRFTVSVTADSNNVDGLHFEFGTDIDTVLYDLTVTPTPASLTAVPKSLKKWNATFSSALNSGSVVTISGYGKKGALQKLSSYNWTRTNVIVGKKLKGGTFTDNTLRLPMPNLHNLGEEIFKQGAFTSTTGMVVGVAHPESPNAYAWVLHKKYSDVQKSLVKKTKTGYLMHDSTARCFDLFKNGKLLVKKQTNLPPDKYDNKLFADLIALRLNIAASQLAKTPVGFGELKVVADGSEIPLVFDGMMVKDIAALADTLLTNCATSRDPFNATDLGNLIAGINNAFSAPFDTVSWGSKLVAKSTVRISEVPFLMRDPSIVPSTIVPLANEVSQLPDKYELYQNYPNPFNPTTKISFDLPMTSKITLKIFNVLGQEVVTLVDGLTMEDGTQEVEFNAQKLATGVYFYQLTATSIEDASGATFTETKKLMLVK